MTYGEVADEVAMIGAALIKAGVQTGDRVALLADNQPRWLMADLAITGIGAADVPRGLDTATSEFQFILEHSEATAAFIQNKRLFNRLADAGALKSLRFVVMLDDSEPNAPEDSPDLQIFPWASFKETGNPDDYHAAAAKVTPEHLATIVYTSGTTGSPKGVMLTHGNLMTQPLGVDLGLTLQKGEILLSVLPAWHAYERAVEYFGIYYGVTICYSDKRFIRDDLLQIQPHLFPCVPRIWEMIYKGIQTKVASAPKKRQKIFHRFLDIGQQYIEARRIATGHVLAREVPSPASRAVAAAKMAALYPLYAAGDRLVYSKIRHITGGRLRAAISGGGSLAPYLDDFFEVVGIPIMNGYGLTETSPVVAVRRSDQNLRGSVGPLMRGTEVRFQADENHSVAGKALGEIQVRGPQVMAGYYKNPEATEEIFTKDGWLKTGDLGWMTAKGDIVIAGRAKDTIVLSSGENVEPDPIEDACRKNPMVQQIVVVGQDQKTLGALVVPDFALLAEKLGLSSETAPDQVTGHPEAVRTVRQALNETMSATENFKASESISKVHLLQEPFSESNGLLTNTMKIRRNKVCERYASDIEAMYQ